jgi:hypothetical protein
VPRLRDALGKLYALCAMYQDMEFFLRPIIEDIEAHGSVSGQEREAFSPDEGNRLPGDLSSR